MKPECVIIDMKAIEQYFHIVLSVLLSLLICFF